MVMTIGVDVGNFNTKSAHTTTVSGYNESSMSQLLADKQLEYNGLYYVESQDKRFPYVEDKRQDDQCLILTLFAIAKEIIYTIQNEKHLVGDIQNEISEITNINLAIGLPPGHFNYYAQDVQDYYKSKMKNGISFNYGAYRFSFKANTVTVYAQDLTPVIIDSSLKVNERDEDKELVIPQYFIIGIGGGTIDIIPIKNGKSSIDEIRSLTLGTRVMFESIISKVQNSTGVTLDESIVENILRNKKTFVPAEAKNEVKKNAEIYAKQIIDRCIQAGCAVNQYPVVYVGGGSLLLKEYLEKNPLVCMSEFITNVNTNACAYEKLYRLQHNVTKG